MVLFPGRKQLDANDPYSAIAAGRQVRLDTSREGVVDDGNIAFEERVLEARRQWPEARAEDFEQIDRRGRLFRDRGSGLEYRRVHGSPLLDLYSPANAAISCFFVANGQLVFLKPADHKDATTVYVGHVVGYQVPGTPVVNTGLY